ncbi:MAG: NAD(P)-dependent oxidoreductase [Myxococcota bacterium]
MDKVRGNRARRQGRRTRSETMAKIGFMGLGAMGSRMATHLVQAGYEVAVWNRSDGATAPLVDLGARAVATPREAAEGARFVISMVTDDQASRTVWLDDTTGALLGLGPDAVAIECSTLTPDWVRELGRAVEKKSARFADAPLAGSRPQAEARQLIFFVGCTPSVFESVQPLLAAMGSVTHHVGAIGNGALIKLAVNALFATQVEVLGELLGMLKKSGIAPDAAMSVLGELPVTSPAAKGMGGLIVAEKFAPMFPVDLVAKDMRYAAKTAEQAGSDAPTLATVRDAYARASAAGHGALNIQGVAKLFL